MCEAKKAVISKDNRDFWRGTIDAPPQVTDLGQIIKAGSPGKHSGTCTSKHLWNALECLFSTAQFQLLDSTGFGSIQALLQFLFDVGADVTDFLFFFFFNRDTNNVDHGGDGEVSPRLRPARRTASLCVVTYQRTVCILTALCGCVSVCCDISCSGPTQVS